MGLNRTPRQHARARDPRRRAGRPRRPRGHAARRAHRERRVSRFVFRLAVAGDAAGRGGTSATSSPASPSGVSALVGVGSFADSLERTVARSARALMGGDVEIRAHAAPASGRGGPARGCRAAERRRPRGVRELVAMAAVGRRAEPPRRAQGGGAGLSVLRRARDRAGAPARDPDRRAAARSCTTRCSPASGSRVGDRLRVGDLELTIAGVIQKEPDRAIGVFSLGPRVLIAAADLDRTGLRAARQPRALPHARPPARGRATPRPSATGSRPRSPPASASRPTARPSPGCGASGISSRCTSGSPGSWR